jgi:type IV pilus assembly protein PilE
MHMNMKVPMPMPMPVPMSPPTLRGSSPGPRRGFSLIEVMIVVAIVGILAAVAYPSYIEQVRRGKRSDAQTVMMEAAQYAQRYYAARNSFDGANGPDYFGKTGLAIAPKGVSAGQQNYNIVLTVVDKQGYTLTATPVQPDPKCNQLTLNDKGQKGVVGGTGDVRACWR